MTNNSLSPTDLLAACRDILSKNGFSEVLDFHLFNLDANTHCLFEDAYSLAAVVVYETWSDLLHGWIDAQTSFVELISNHISKEEQKSWEGYLLIWTTDFVPISEIDERQRIQYDIGRVRKLVSTGENLNELADIERALLPLLPISDSFEQKKETSILERIPNLLATKELPKEKIRAVIDAFETQNSALESLHNLGGEK